MKKKSTLLKSCAHLCKVLFVFLLMPMALFSQNTLVKWYNADMSPTILDEKIQSASLKSNGIGFIDQKWGDENVFYQSSSWPQPVWNLSPEQTWDPNKYIQFSINSSSGYKINLKNFNFSGRAQGGNTQRIKISYSTNENFTAEKVLLKEQTTSTDYIQYNLPFPAGTFVQNGEAMYIRIYIYNSNDNFHIQHNLSGTIAPHITGEVVASAVVKPIAFNDKAGMLKNTSSLIDVMANDSFSPGVPMTTHISTVAKNGVVEVQNNGKILYTPNSNFTGYDEFYYTIKNSAGESNAAKVEVQVVEHKNEKVLVRWNKENFTSTLYDNYVNGSDLAAHNIIRDKNMYGSLRFFTFNGLPTPQQFNGTLDPNKFIEFSVNSIAENLLYINKLQLNYRFGDKKAGSVTIKYSKTKDFTSNVITLLDNKYYNSDWTLENLGIASPVVVFPGETLYFRLYPHNTVEQFQIKYVLNGDEGPALSGFSVPYLTSEQPCTKTVTWNGSSWDAQPNINRIAKIAGNYDTAIKGSFEACRLDVASGMLTISKDTNVKVTNQITVNTAANIIVKSGGNLIQINDAAVNIGAIQVERDINISKTRFQYNYLGSPVTFSAGESFKTIYSGIPMVTYYNEANNYFYSSSGANVPGRGLAVKEPNLSSVPETISTVTAKYKGVPQNGVINFPLANSNTSTVTNLGYNLLGNPYPSNIDLVELYKINSSGGEATFNSTFYFWDNTVNDLYTQQGSGYKGQSYAVFNSMAGSSGTGLSAPASADKIGTKKVPTHVLPVGQGFIVKATQKNKNFMFNNSVRSAAQSPVHFMGKTSSEVDDRYYISMKTPTNLVTSHAIVYFNNGTAGVGAEDTKSTGADDEVFSIVDGSRLMINGKQSFNNTDVVKIGTRHFSSGQYTLSLDRKEGVFIQGQQVYLKDKLTNTVTNLSEGSYTFAANAGETSDRFEIMYVPQTVLATDANVREVVRVYRAGEEFIVESKGEKIEDIEVFDIAGRLILKANVNAAQYRFSLSESSKGLYLIKVNQKSGKTIKKILN